MLVKVWGMAMALFAGEGREREGVERLEIVSVGRGWGG